MKRFSLLFLSLLLPLLISCVTTGILDINEMIGEYQDCYFACTIVNIKPNYTFEIKYEGDLYGGIGTTGKLKPLGKNEYLAIGDVKPFFHREFSRDLDSVVIIINDEENRRLNYANLTIENKDNIVTYNTDTIGIIKIPKQRIEKIKVKHLFDSVYYKIQNQEADSIIIKFTSSALLANIQNINEIWYFKNDSVIILPNGKKIKKIK